MTVIKEWAVKVTLIKGPGSIRTDLSDAFFHPKKNEARGGALEPGYQSALWVTVRVSSVGKAVHAYNYVFEDRGREVYRLVRKNGTHR